MLIQTWASWDH